MIPSSWQETTIGDICDFENGHGFRPPDWSKSGIPIIRIQNLNGSKDFNYFAGEPQKDWIVEPGTLLFAWAGVKGVSFGPKIWDGPRGVLNQHIYKIHPKANMDVDLQWLYAMFKVITSRIEKNAHGFKASLLHVHKADITGQEIYLPPLPEQRKIADILSTWDEAIDLTEQLITAKQKRKQALMQRLLTGKVRFSGFKDLWTELKINELGEIYSGGTPDTSNPQYWDGDINWCTPTEITALIGRFILDTEQKISEAGLKNSSAKLLPIGSILVCTRATVGACAIAASPMTTNQGFKNIVLFENFDPNFIYYLLMTKKHEMLKYSSGSTFLELSKQSFEQIKVHVPSQKEQQKIASVLISCDDEIDFLQQKLAALRQQKKGLMQQLLTGKIRVKV